MKLYLIGVVVGFALSSCTNAHAETYLIKGKLSTKLESIKALLNDPKIQVERCNQVTLTDKATLKTKK